MALVGCERKPIVSKPDALTTRPPPFPSKLFNFFYQEEWSDWRAQKRPSIYKRSRAVIGR